MKLVTRAVAAALCIASMTATSAMAASVVTISGITAVWSNPNPVSPGGIPVALGPSANFTSARWGDPATAAGKSGYDFDGADGTVGFTVDPPTVPTSSPPAQIGEFTHLNQPIFGGTSITSIKLTVSALVAVDAVSLGTRSFVFDFDHWETNNGAVPCANPAADNSNGCADRVKVSYSSTSESFKVGDIDYTLLITGFQTSPGGSVLSEFWTKEEANNKAGLYAVVTSTKDAQSTVPVPAALPLLLSGLAGLGFVGRRRRNKSA
jgi:hypothetical protein